MLNVGIVMAPPDPNQGEETDEEIVGDWNWNVKAFCWGHWRYQMGTPGYAVFVQWYDEGSRSGGLGVWYTGTLNFTWRHDGFSSIAYVDGSGMKTGTYSGQTFLINCTAASGFANWWGQGWEEDASAQLLIS